MSSSLAPSPDDLRQLLSMGFDPDQSRIALQKHRTLEHAIEWLFTHPNVASLAASKQPQQQTTPSVARTAQTHASTERIRTKTQQPQAFPLLPSIPAASASAAPSSSSALPPEWHQGRVLKFFDKNKDGAPHSGFGFICPEGPFGGEDLYFAWKNVLSSEQNLPPPPTTNGSGVVKMAMDYPNEPYFTTGDIVAYRVFIQKGYIDKSTGEVRDQKAATDVKLLSYSKNHKFRRTQAQVLDGENAPMVQTNVMLASAASASAAATSASSSSRSSGNIVPSIPSAPFSELVGSRMRGVIHTLCGIESDEPGAAGGVNPIARKSLPHGFLAAHHVSNASVMFLLSEFKESKPSSTSSSSSISSASSLFTLRHKLHVGDVLEFTLIHDDVINTFMGRDLSIIPTLTFGQVIMNVRKQRQQESIGLTTHLAQLEDALELVYVQGSKLEADESKVLEFKSLTRSSSSYGMQQSLSRMADKYMNGFLNSSGGTILFGVEDNGLVVGLTASKSDRDSLRLTTDSFMKESTPSVSPSLYTFRFIKVVRVYKSSWVLGGGAGGGGGGGVPSESIGAQLSRMSSVDEMIQLMHTPDPLDRVEQLDGTFIIAILTAPGSSSSNQQRRILYQTSGKGYPTKECFERREGQTIRLSPSEIEQRVANQHGQKEEEQAAALNELLQTLSLQAQAQAQAAPTQLTPELMATIVKQVEEKMKADMAAAASAAATAAAAPSTNVHVAPVSGSSSSVAPSSSSSALVGDLSSSDDFAVPSQLLTVLTSAGFQRSLILDACYALHESKTIDFRRVFKTQSSEDENTDAMNRVINLILANMATTPTTPPATTTQTTQQPAVTEVNTIHEANVQMAHPIVAAPPAMPTFHTPYAPLLDPFGHPLDPHSHLPPSSSGVYPSLHFAGPSPFAYPDDMHQPGLAAATTFPSYAPPHVSPACEIAPLEPSSQVDSSSSSFPVVVGDDWLPCELCCQLFPFDRLESHQEACRAERIRQHQQQQQQRQQQAPHIENQVIEID